MADAIASAAAVVVGSRLAAWRRQGQGVGEKHAVLSTEDIPVLTTFVVRAAAPACAGIAAAGAAAALGGTALLGDAAAALLRVLEATGQAIVRPSELIEVVGGCLRALNGAVQWICHVAVNAAANAVDATGSAEGVVVAALPAAFVLLAVLRAAITDSLVFGGSNALPTRMRAMALAMSVATDASVAAVPGAAGAASAGAAACALRLTLLIAAASAPVVCAIAFAVIAGSVRPGDLQPEATRGRTGALMRVRDQGGVYHGEWGRAARDAGEASASGSGAAKNSDGKHGYGIYAYTNGDVYQGEWRRNVKEGRGVYTFRCEHEHEHAHKHEHEHALACSDEFVVSSPLLGPAKTSTCGNAPIVCERWHAPCVLRLRMCG